MKNKYSDDLTILLTRSYPELGAAYKLEFKNLFGAVAGYVDGQIFISCGRFGVALKLPAQTLNGLFAMRDVDHLRYFPKGAHVEVLLRLDCQFQWLILHYENGKRLNS